MDHRYNLKRELGLWEVTLTGIGIILGAGIYALVGKAAGLAGGGVWIAFLVAALLASLTGLSYAELSSLFPRAGAEYVYTRKSFGKTLAFLVGWLVLFGGIMGGATVALGFAGYFAALFATPILGTAIVLMLVVGLIMFWGIKQSTRLAVAFTLVETAGLLIIIALGIPHLGSVDYFAIPSLEGVFSSAALIFFAFVGFEAIVRLSEETKKPQKTIPKALLIAIVVTTVLYMLVAIAAISIIPPAELAASDAPLADVASRALGFNSFLLLSVIALFSTFNTVLLFLLGASRIAYGIAREGSLPKMVGRVHSARRTPHVAIGVVILITILAVFAGDIAVVANVTNFTIYITFIVINASVIALRYKQKGKRLFKVPVNVGRFPILPLIGVLTSVVMLASLGVDIIAYGVVLLLLGWGVHLGMGRHKGRR